MRIIGVAFSQGILGIAGLLAAHTQAAKAVDVLDLTLDFAEILRLDRPAGTIVIGNPDIADATVGDERTLVLTGRSTGSTNMIILDEDGREIASTVLRVDAGAGNRVSVRYGFTRYTFMCTQGCVELDAINEVRQPPEGPSVEVQDAEAVEVQPPEEAPADGAAAN